MIWNKKNNGSHRTVKQSQHGDQKTESKDSGCLLPSRDWFGLQHGTSPYAPWPGVQPCWVPMGSPIFVRIINMCFFLLCYTYITVNKKKNPWNFGHPSDSIDTRTCAIQLFKTLARCQIISGVKIWLLGVQWRYVRRYVNEYVNGNVKKPQKLGYNDITPYDYAYIHYMYMYIYIYVYVYV